MTRGILIAGNESSLFSALCVEAAKRVETYAAAPIPHETPVRNSPAGPDGDGRNRQLTLDWNPASPLSGRALVLAATNRLEHIDDAVLVCAPPACRKNPEDLSSAEIDGLVDHNIKGWLFLVRELTALFRARQSGTLALVLPELGAGAREDPPDLLGPPAAAAFRSFAQGVLLASLHAPYQALGFTSSEGGEENAFAAHVFKTMEAAPGALPAGPGRHLSRPASAGKWHKFGRLGIFGR